MSLHEHGLDQQEETVGGHHFAISSLWALATPVLRVITALLNVDRALSG
jgi:hypothetical protein